MVTFVIGRKMFVEEKGRRSTEAEDCVGYSPLKVGLVSGEGLEETVCNALKGA